MDFTRPELVFFRPFDHNDKFFGDPNRLTRLENFRRTFFSDTIAQCGCSQEIYDMAFNKCARLTMVLSNVPNSPEMSHKEVKNELLSALADFSLSYASNSFISVRINSRPEGHLLCPCFATVFTSGAECDKPLLLLENVMMQGEIFLRIRNNDHVLSVFEVGCQPVQSSLQFAVRELKSILAQRLRALFSPLNSPNAPTAVMPAAVATLPAPPSVAFPPVPSWSPSFAIADPRASILPANHPFLSRLNDELSRKKDLLHVRLEDIRSKSEIEKLRAGYWNLGGTEWFETDQNGFQLGKGAEAVVYIGLLSRGADTTPIPVAVKQSLRRLIMENAKEAEICMNYGGSSIVKYYSSSTQDEGRYTVSVLTQELGVCNLRRLIDNANLSFEQKYRATLALIAASSELHRRVPVVVHRDLRPENILLMPDGTLRLTDLGLAVVMRNDVHSTLVRSLLTYGQPFEVQDAFTKATTDVHGNFIHSEADLRELPVSAAGDIFMLGRSITCLFGGRDTEPFLRDTDILMKRDPVFPDEMRRSFPWLVHLLRAMMSHQKDNRPTEEEILKHPFIRGVPNLSAYLLTALFDGIERIVVADFPRPNCGPRDDAEFKKLEMLLLPIEDYMRGEEDAGRAWYTKLPDNVLRGNRPQTAFNPIEPVVRFLAEGQGVAVRQFPLPKVSKYLHWMRNILVHFGTDASLMNNIWRCKATSLPGYPLDACYDSVGEFFAHHPGVSWFLPMYWEQYCAKMRSFRTNRREMKLRHEEEANRLQADMLEFHSILL